MPQSRTPPTTEHTKMIASLSVTAVDLCAERVAAFASPAAPPEVGRAAVGLAVARCANVGAGDGFGTGPLEVGRSVGTQLDSPCAPPPACHSRTHGSSEGASEPRVGNVDGAAVATLGMAEGKGDGAGVATLGAKQSEYV